MTVSVGSRNETPRFAALASAARAVPVWSFSTRLFPVLPPWASLKV